MKVFLADCSHREYSQLEEERKLRIKRRSEREVTREKWPEFGKAHGMRSKARGAKEEARCEYSQPI